MFKLSQKYTARANRIMDNFYKNYNTVISFDSPKFQLSGHPVQQAIESFDNELRKAPAMATDR